MKKVNIGPIARITINNTIDAQLKSFIQSDMSDRYSIGCRSLKKSVEVIDKISKNIFDIADDDICMFFNLCDCVIE